MKVITLFYYCKLLGICSNVLKKAHRHTLYSQTVFNLDRQVCTNVLKTTLTFTIDYMMSNDYFYLLFKIWFKNWIFSEVNRCHKQQNAFFNKWKRFDAAWGMERVVHPAHKRLQGLHKHLCGQLLSGLYTRPWGASEPGGSRSIVWIVYFVRFLREFFVRYFKGIGLFKFDSIN